MPCPDGDACPDARRYGAIHPAPHPVMLLAVLRAEADVAAEAARFAPHAAKLTDLSLLGLHDAVRAEVEKRAAAIKARADREDGQAMGVAPAPGASIGNRT